MTDRERYKRTFSQLHASEEIFMEVASMKKIKIFPVRRLVAVAAAALLIAAMATVAYAADVGGIQETVRIWLSDGTPLDVTYITGDLSEAGDGKYTISYKDNDGNEQIVYTTITSADTWENHADADVDVEIMGSLGIFEVEYRDDGTVWVHYNDRDIEITDLFEDGVCHLELENEQFETEDGEEAKSVYLTIQYGEGEGYASASDFLTIYNYTVDTVDMP